MTQAFQNMTADFFDDVARNRTGWERVVNINVPDKERETELQKTQITKMFTEAEWRGMGVLDVGCGVGRLTRWLDEIAADAWGLDWSDEMLRIAREEAPQVKFLKGDIGASNTLPDFQTDVIFTWCVFIHLTDDTAWRGAVANMKRWARSSILYCDKVNDNATVPYVKVRSEKDIVREVHKGGKFALAKIGRWHSEPEDDFVLLRFDRVAKPKHRNDAREMVAAYA